MEETENQSKLIRSNADQLECLCNERLTQLIQENKKLKKQFQEELSSILSRFTQVSEIFFSTALEFSLKIHSPKFAIR